MNYNEMTAAQCADWLAERDRWEPDNGCGWRREIPERREYEYRDTHPMPLTLDAAAGALQEPAFITAIRRVVTIANLRCEGSDVIYSWSVDLFTHFDASMRQIVGPDELTARYRAAVAARMEEDNAK